MSSSGQTQGETTMRLGTRQSRPAGTPAIRRPAYDRSRVKPGIVHLGIGAFHRAHQAVVMDDALRPAPSGWGIVGASLRRPDTRDALDPQDRLYTLAVRDAAARPARHRLSARQLVAPEEPARCRADGRSRIRIVSLTVTEKGYCHTPPTGDLDERHPDIVHDLNNSRAASAPGFLVEALARRRAQGFRRSRCCPATTSRPTATPCSGS